ncbi:immunity 70 family protein [Isobaculum melis]|uniref:Immunity protein 70 n=1 Tax=Isobaculum melis TaxID=142588 RepID=A0A1H9U3C4_9LACT|nr:immunity 70 family protein [Isobaculum melis]SES03674.1 Immunity protein 70 [Isobaculum melis]
MTVGIKVDFLWYSIGTGEFFNSFFSTVYVNLENKKWGSRFPLIMKNLYSGTLDIDELNIAKNELSEIKQELFKLAPNKIIWDAKNLQKSPPWGSNISQDIKTLADYFVTSDGENLFSVLDDALNRPYTKKCN